jgi:hypothetical protein
MMLAGSDEKSARTAADELAAAGHKELGIRCDVSDEKQFAAIVEQAVSNSDVLMLLQQCPHSGAAG